MHSSAVCAVESVKSRHRGIRSKVQHCQGRCSLFFAACACASCAAGGRHFSLITAVKLVPALVSLSCPLLPPCLGSLPPQSHIDRPPVVKSGPKKYISQSFRMSSLGSWGLALATLASSTSAFSIEGLTSELGLSEALMEGEPR